MKKYLLLLVVVYSCIRNNNNLVDNKIKKLDNNYIINDTTIEDSIINNIKLFYYWYHDMYKCQGLEYSKVDSIISKKKYFIELPLILDSLRKDCDTITAFFVFKDSSLLGFRNECDYCFYYTIGRENIQSVVYGIKYNIKTSKIIQTQLFISPNFIPDEYDLNKIILNNDAKFQLLKAIKANKLKVDKWLLNQVIERKWIKN